MRHSPRIIVIHLTLLIVTFVTTTLAGVQWLNKDPFEFSNFSLGLPYSTLLILVLGSHEMGHYFAARLHGIPATLPFFIPFPSLSVMSFVNPFGTMGAVIRLKGQIPSRTALLDVGCSGPIAGFIVSMVVLALGFQTLPQIDYLYSIHPEYAQLTTTPKGGWTFGKTLLYSLFEILFAPKGAFLPPMNEIYHYPLLCVGWFGMLITAINLIPIGQLDGGHISRALFGEQSQKIKQIALTGLILLGLAGFLPMIGVDFDYGYTGWLFWAGVLLLMEKVFRSGQVPLMDDSPLHQTRIVIGWTCFLIFIGSVSLTPFSFVIP